jgi:hypothetical protein
MHVNIKRHVIDLPYLAIIVVTFSGGGNHEDGVPMMDITPVRWRW